MSLTLKLHGPFHQLSEDGLYPLNIKGPITVEKLRQQLHDQIKIQHPQLAQLIDHCRFAAHEALITDESSEIKADQLTILPPVSGG